MALQPNDLVVVSRGGTTYQTTVNNLLDGAGDGVTVSETAPSNPVDGQLWWADSDVDEGGGRLYIWTGDEWVDASLPGGSGGGGGDTNYSGASAWGYTTVGGGFLNGLNIASMSNPSPGRYEYTFDTPMPNARYSIVATSTRTDAEQRTINWRELTTTGFVLEACGADGTLGNGAHTFTVHATNALPPKGGTGADAWGIVSGDGTLKNGLNATSSKISTGEYEVTFTTPMPNANYAVSLTAHSPSGTTIPTVYAQSETGFKYTRGANNVAVDGATDFIVHATNAQLPDTFLKEDVLYVDGRYPSTGTQEFQGGVKVTGGDATSVDTGIYADTSGRLAAAKGGADAAVFNPQGESQFTVGSSSRNKTSTGLQGISSTWSSANHGTQAIDLFYAPVIGDTNTSGSVNGMRVAVGTTQSNTGEFVGYRSVINTSDVPSGKPYNFYAAGTAPNYFAGDIAIATNNNSPGFGNTLEGIRLRADYRAFFSSNNIALSINRNNSPGPILTFRYNGGTGEAGNPSAGSVQVTGNRRTVYSCGLNSTTSGFVSESDYRLKENIQDLASATAAVKLLKPKTFNYIGSNETVQGFVAHELQEVNSFYATGTKDETEAIGTYTDPDGVVETEVTEPEAIPYGATWEQTGTRPVYQGVDQTKLIPLLTKALQETIAKNEELEARLAALEGGTN